MKTFDRQIKSIKSKKIAIAVITLITAILIFIFAITQLLPRDINYTEFNKGKKIGNYAKATLYYLIGPILEVQETSDQTRSGYYIGVGKDENLFIIRLNKDNIDIPILGQDIEENNIDSLEEKEIYGNVQLISYSLRDALNNRLNNILKNEVANNSSFEKVFGGYYLDTVKEKEDNSAKLFIASAIFAIIGILYLIVNKSIRKNVDQTLEKLKIEGKLDEVIKEFDEGRLIEYKKLKVYLSDNYIFSYPMGLDIIAFKDIKEVSISKRRIGNPDKNRYIVILTKEDIEHYIAPMNNIRQKIVFNELLSKIKTSI